MTNGMPKPEFCTRFNGSTLQRLNLGEAEEWAVKVSNLRPSRCKRDALPLS